jgi:hypothetical protein
LSFLNAGQSAFPLVSTNDPYIEANIRETDLTYVKEGNPARVTIDAYPDSPVAGKRFGIRPVAAAKCHRQLGQGRAADTGSPFRRPAPGRRRVACRDQRQDLDRYRPSTLVPRVVA